jgi:hypothetical protein
MNCELTIRPHRIPNLASRVQELNHVAGEMMLDGMLAYGWTHEAIFGTKTRLRNALALHCPHLLNSLVRQSEDPYPSPTQATMVLTSSPDLTTAPTLGSQETFICEPTSMEVDYFHEFFPPTPSLPAELQLPLSLPMDAGTEIDSDAATPDLLASVFCNDSFCLDEAGSFGTSSSRCSVEGLSTGEALMTIGLMAGVKSPCVNRVLAKPGVVGLNTFPC